MPILETSTTEILRFYYFEQFCNLLKLKYVLIWKKKFSADGCSSLCLSPSFIISKILVGQTHSLCEQSLGPLGLSLYISNELMSCIQMKSKWKPFFIFLQCYFSALEYSGCLFISWCKWIWGIGQTERCYLVSNRYLKITQATWA